jgi:holo-[acyl-carrier protein] synthase
MNQQGVGIDIENIDRFNCITLSDHDQFLKKIYTEKELEYCFSKKDAAHHLAVRFSGKEAVVKALKSMGINNIFYNDIEILNNETGIPEALIHKKEFNGLVINISLSHCADKCCAVAMIFGVPGNEENTRDYLIK